MHALLGRRLNRRALLGTLLATAAIPAVATRLAHAQGWSPEATFEGDCADEPAVQMLFDWRDGKQIYPNLGDMAPQPDWEMLSHPSLPVPYLMPPDWTWQGLWADSFTRDAEPEWQEEPLYLPQLTASRLVSPDGDAVFEYAVGSIQAIIDTSIATTTAQQSFLGANPKLRQVCLIDDPLAQPAGSWFTVDRHGSSLLITSGNVMQLPHDIAPATVVSYTSLYGPHRDMEDLMYNVFLRILYQFLGTNNGDVDPTPTP